MVPESEETVLEDHKIVLSSSHLPLHCNCKKVVPEPEETVLEDQKIVLGSSHLPLHCNFGPLFFISGALN
jgi:hypothetical protein